MGRLQAVSGANNKYGPLQIKRMGPCMIEERPVPNMTSNPVAPMVQHDTEGPWWCRTCKRDAAMQIAVASSGAVGMVLCLSCVLALLFCCCKSCSHRHANQHQCGADDC